MDAIVILKKYEKLVYFILILLFALIVAFSICELIYLVALSLVVDTPLLLENHELLNIFGYFLLVLIGVELLATIAAYISDKVIHVEIVILVAIIATVRGVILVDTNTINALNMFGIAAIIFTLCSGYYFLSKGGLIGRQQNGNNTHFTLQSSADQESRQVREEPAKHRRRIRKYSK